MKNLSIDLETYSSVEINKAGVYRYSESPDFEVLLFGYSVDGAPAQVVDLACGESIPAEIQEALVDPAVTNQNPPVQYVVYSSTMTEDAHQDDHVQSFRTYVYLNLWSDIDPTEAANRIRSAMYAAGFVMVEESDKGYNQPAYDIATHQYTVQWTWCLYEEALEDAP